MLVITATLMPWGVCGIFGKALNRLISHVSIFWLSGLLRKVTHGHRKISSALWQAFIKMEGWIYRVVCETHKDGFSFALGVAWIDRENFGWRRGDGSRDDGTATEARRGKTWRARGVKPATREQGATLIPRQEIPINVSHLSLIILSYCGYHVYGS